MSNFARIDAPLNKRTAKWQSLEFESSFPELDDFFLKLKKKLLSTLIFTLPGRSTLFTRMHANSKLDVRHSRTNQTVTDFPLATGAVRSRNQKRVTLKRKKMFGYRAGSVETPVLPLWIMIHFTYGSKFVAMDFELSQ